MEEEKKSFKVCLKDWVEKNTVVALICALVLGLVVGLVGMYLCNGDTKVAKVNGKSITESTLYNKLKGYMSINIVLEEVDDLILKNKYELTKDEYNDLKDTAQQYIDMYKSYYGYTEEDFLTKNGFASLNDFIEYLSIDYKRTVYFYETIEKQLDKDAVKDYYDANAFGKVNTKHILVQTSDNMTDEKALELANEIIGRLDNGEDFDTLAEEYQEKYPDEVVVEDLGEKGAFDNLDEAYVEGMKALNKDEYSKTPVESSFGYHIIYCVDKVEKTDDISRKDKMTIIQKLGVDIINADTDLYTKTLIQMRKDANLKFYDEKLKEEYDEFCLPYNAEETDETDETEGTNELEENIEIDISSNTDE